MRTILLLAFRNLSRNRRRSLLAIIAIGFAVLTVVFFQGFMAGMMNDMADNFAALDSGHVKVMQGEYWKKIRLSPLYSYIDGLRGGEGWTAVADVARANAGAGAQTTGRIRFGFLLGQGNRNRACIGMACDPAVESKFNPLFRALIDGGQAPGNSPVLTPSADGRTMRAVYQVMVGAKLAEDFGLRKGGRLTVMAATAQESLGAMDFIISGIFRYGVREYDERIIVVPLAAAQQLLRMPNGVTEILVFLPDRAAAPAVAQRITAALRTQGGGSIIALPWQKQSGLLGMFLASQQMMVFFYIALVALSALVVLNTLMMIVMERMPEIGTLRALGMYGREVIVMLVAESFWLSVIGSVLGGAAGALVLGLLSWKGFNLAALLPKNYEMGISDLIFPVLNPAVVFVGVALGVDITTALSWLPTRRAARTNLLEMLRDR